MTDLKKLGRYELRRVLGKGAMGVVYEGFDPTLGRRVAVKTILRSVALDEETQRDYAERFEREARAVARLNHPHIVQVHDFGEQEDVAYLVMEFIEGRELRAFFDAHEHFAPAEAARIMGELLDGLDFAHERGVIHRDVKPANVMMDSKRRVKLADFGVARILDSDRSQAGTMVGTPAFMSPEQIKGGKIDGRTDIFSAGTILYQLLTGEQPFKGEGAWTVAKKIVEDDPPPPSSLSVSISPALDAVVRKALAKNPAQRYGKAHEFAAALRGALANPALAPAAAAPKAPGKSETKASETELEFWRSIQNRDDLEELELYVEQFPDGAYTQLALLKIAKLRAPLEAARKAAEEKARLEAEEKSGREAEENAKREAADGARRAAEAKAQREAAEKARRETEEAAKRDAEEKARRDAAAKAKRESEEKARQAQALVKLKLQEEAARRAKAVQNVDATVAIGGGKGPPAPPLTAERKPSLAILAVVAAVAIAGAAGAYIVLGRKSAPTPAAEAPASVPAAPPKAEVSAADIEKIKKETEERIRREYADKSAAEQAAAAKAASEKAIQEKQLAMKAAVAEKIAAEKAAADKVQAEKLAAAKSAAERAALEKAAATEKAAAERAASEKAAQEKAAAENLAAEKVAAEKAAAEKAAAAKAAAAARPGWPNVGDRWVYEVRDGDQPDKKMQVVVEVQSTGATGIRDVSRVQGGEAVVWTHTAIPQLVGLTPGIASFSPYLRAFQDLRSGDRWASVEYKRLWDCGSLVTCNASARIVGREKVSVKAGTFDAWRIAVELYVAGSQRGGVATATFWFAESAKRVVKYQFRQNITLNNSSGTWTQPNIDMELVSYTLAE